MSLKVYRGRTLARSQALQLLFQAEATDSPLERVLEGDFLISKGPLDPYALELCRGAYEHIDRIDCALRSVAKNWDLMRMPGADRNLLRIAVYEMRFLTDEEVSDAIVINEAVELAKAYGTDQSASFVNGVLGKIARSEELPGEDLYQELLAEDRAREEAQAAERSLAPLTEREKDILGCLAGGLSNKLIARDLNIAEGTVKNHVSALLRKLDKQDTGYKL